MRKSLLILTLLASGCATAPGSLEALCDGTAKERTDHAAALADDGGPESVVTGQALISKIDQGCGV